MDAVLRKNNADISGRLHLTGSKSISNRVLIMAELSKEWDENIEFDNLSEADDTLRLQYYLEEIRSCSLQCLPLVINTENAGTVMRFLSSFLTVKKGKWLLTGSKRMQNRPIEILVDALKELGADINYTEREGHPPLLITGDGLRGGEISMDASVSSQFISSLMMIAPVTEKGIYIHFSERPVSFPYIDMTRKLMAYFGVDIELTSKSVKVNPSQYLIRDFAVEPDWSAASYWYEVLAIAGKGEIFLEGFSKESVQGDSRVSKLFKDLGVQTKFEKKGVRISATGKRTEHFTCDFTNIPDLVPAVLATCAALRIPATIKGVAHLKYKESDRMQVLRDELGKTGALLKEKDSVFELSYKKSFRPEKQLIFETYGDHRMAMSFAPLVLKYDEITIMDKDVVEKSYPGFWNDLQQLGIVLPIS
jgi:3-phosphoshikimate 1-carboxyvinyltransferase